MSTWTETVTYIKSQLRPGVLGNTNVQKILNAVLAVVQQINGGDFSPTPDALWKADVTYASDIQPVLWQDQWLVSNIADNLGNVPISTSGVVHPSWRVIGSSAGSGIRLWQAIVYPNTLEIVFQAGQLYYLDRGVVGEDPFVSVDFAVELGEEKWLPLLEIPEHNALGGIQGGTWHLTEEQHATAVGITRSLDEEGDPDQYQFPTPVKGSPAVNEDEFVTKSQLPTVTQYGLLNGGTIQWRGDGLWFLWAPAVVAIGGPLTAPDAQIELDAAHPTLNREDLLGWLKVDDTTAIPHVIVGTPSSVFSPPPYDPTTFVPGIPVKIPAAATTPDGTITTENVYLDNAPEWAVTFSGTGTGNANSTSNPDGGTGKAVEVTNPANQFRARFTRSTALDLSTLEDATLGLRLDLKAVYSNSQNLEIVFLDASNNPVSNVLQLTLNKALLDYQFIGFPLSDLTFTSTTVKAIEIIYRQRGGGTHAGFWIDNVKLQGGVTQPEVTLNQNHNSLQNLQGGSTTERYHLTKDQADAAAAAASPSAANPFATMADIPTPLASGIVDGLNASLADSPGPSNKYVTVNLLNSYAYVQEAPINGNFYARKDGAWQSFTPFTVAGTPTAGHVVTSVAGVPTWAAPSGGGGLQQGVNVLTETLTLRGHGPWPVSGSVINESLKYFSITDSTGAVEIFRVHPQNGNSYEASGRVTIHRSNLLLDHPSFHWGVPVFTIRTVGVDRIVVMGNGSLSANAGIGTTSLTTSGVLRFNTPFSGWGNPEWWITYGGTAQGNRQIWSTNGVLATQELNARAKNDTTSYSLIVANLSAVKTMEILGNHKFFLYQMPSTDPLEANRIWVDSSGYVRRSAG